MKHISQQSQELYLSNEIENFRTNFVETEKLYHYTSFENAVKIIATGKLRYSRLNGLNDINEAHRVECLDTCGRVSSSDYDQSFACISRGVISRALRNFRQISLSMDKEEKPGFAILPMWGHYAQKGKGVCLVFDKKKLLSKLLPGEYGEVKYDSQAGNSLIMQRVDTVSKYTKYIDDHKPELFFTKDSAWSYEQEFRIVKKYRCSQEGYLNIRESLMFVIIYGYEDHDKDSMILKSAKIMTLKNILDNKKKICEYGSFFCEKNLRYQGCAIWSSAANISKFLLD